MSLGYIDYAKAPLSYRLGVLQENKLDELHHQSILVNQMAGMVRGGQGSTVLY